MDVDDDDDDDDVADKSRRTFSGPRSLEFPTRKTKTNEISLSLFCLLFPAFCFCRLSRRTVSSAYCQRALARTENGPFVLVFVVFTTSDVSTTAQTFLLVLPRAHFFLFEGQKP